MDTLNDDITRIVTPKDGEELVDVKLLVRQSEDVSEAKVAHELAEAFGARRSGHLKTMTSSPEKVKSVKIGDFIPALS